jgi:hypothetical protein
MGSINKTFAITQHLRCADKGNLKTVHQAPTRTEDIRKLRSRMWQSCKWRHDDNELALMGYSMRTEEYRYTAYVHYNRTTHTTVPLGEKPVIEELYSHNSSIPAVYRELRNLARDKEFHHIREGLFQLLVQHVKSQLQYLDDNKIPH